MDRVHQQRECVKEVANDEKSTVDALEMFDPSRCSPSEPMLHTDGLQTEVDDGPSVAKADIATAPKKATAPPSVEEFVSEAERLVRLGLDLIPVWGIVIDSNGNVRCACPKGVDCLSPGKHPAIDHGAHGATRDLTVLKMHPRDRQLNNRHPNLGIVVGDDYVVFDCDVRNGGDDSLRALEEKYGPLPRTWEYISGGGGWNRIYLRPEHVALRKSVGKVAPGIDLLTGYSPAVIPPSLHRSGRRYEWVPGHAPGEIDVAMMPDWLVEEAVRASGRSRSTATVPASGGEVSDRIPEGQRNSTLTSLAGTMHRRGMTMGAIEAALLAENAAKCDPPLSEGEVRSIAASVSRYRAGDVGEDDPSVEIGDQLPPSVVALIAVHRRAQSLFEGKGKPGVGSDGRALDTSPRGYDFSFALALAKKGIVDVGDLATALACRPDGHAISQGRAYIITTAKRALAFVDNGAPTGPVFQPQFGTTAAAGSLSDATPTSPGGPTAIAPASGATPGPIQIIVEAVRVYCTEPPRYELRLDGRWCSFKTELLLNMMAFRSRFFEHMRALPVLPRGKNLQAEWEALVHAWMAQAEVIELPPDATEDGALAAAIKRAITELQVGEAVEDLDDGKGFMVGKRLIFKTIAIERYLRARVARVGVEDIGRHLRNLGYESKCHRYGTAKGETVRAWVKGKAHKGGLSASKAPSVPPPAAPTTAPPQAPSITAASTPRDTVQHAASPPGTEGTDPPETGTPPPDAASEVSP